MRALRTAALLIALAGATTAHADAPKATTLSAIESEKLLALYAELVDHAVKNASDCPALAGALNGVVNRQINTIQMLWSAKRNKKTIPAEVQAQLDRRAGELVGALRGCWGDVRVKKEFDRMKPPPDKRP